MTETQLVVEQRRMNDSYRRIMAGLHTNAERDVRLARTAADSTGLAKAQARLDTLDAALEIYAAAHKLGHGVRPWPRGERNEHP